MSSYKPPAPKYVGPAKNYSKGGNKPINRIVIHSTVGPTKKGSAQKIADYFKRTTRSASAHYVVDEDTVLQVVLDGDVAYHAPPNRHSIGIEMCDYPVPRGKKRWDDAEHKKMFRLTARLTAELCLAYDIPVVLLNAKQLRAGRRGITTHAEVGKAWGLTSHWDPGAWPHRAFIKAVNEEVAKIKNEGKPKPPAERPVNQQVRGPLFKALAVAKAAKKPEWVAAIQKAINSVPQK